MPTLKEETLTRILKVLNSGSSDSIARLLETINTSLSSLNIDIDTLNVNTDELEARIGEISVTPTVNTMQDRLKGIKATLDTSGTTLTTVSNNVKSKYDRIIGTANYNVAITYSGSTRNPTQLVHTGTTDLGAETLTETVTYINAAGGDFRVQSITYS